MYLKAFIMYLHHIRGFDWRRRTDTTEAPNFPIHQIKDYVPVAGTPEDPTHWHIVFFILLHFYQI